jgi:hypothetical protein
MAERIPSRYRRCVVDLPCVGRPVTLLLTVRKFFCPNPACSRKIFAEQFPELVHSYARMTNRLSQALQAIGFATCGELGERLAPKLGMQVSAPTFLRCMRTRSYTPPSSVRNLGIDDWAWNKGQTYGTILVDLQTRRPIELLPDRSPETVEAWLRTHPEVEIVSRDRGGDYAAAARKGASQARTAGRQIPLVEKSPREAEAISWIGEPPVYPKWKKPEPMRFLQKHKGSTLLQQSIRSQNHEQSQQQRNTIARFRLLPINALQHSVTPNCRSRHDGPGAMLVMKTSERSLGKE